MRLLGAILAGGQARRFGSDKALAGIDGQPMLDHVAQALAVECEAVVVVGRDWPGLERIDDRPRGGLGPLGGLAGALAHAERAGFDAVLTSGCDLPALPAGLANLLAPADAVLRGQPTIGLWRSEHARALEIWLERREDRSIRAWADHIGARRIGYGSEIANINTPDDLAAFVELGVRREDPRSSR
ncbi:MAG: molybdopterin-guanine [Sphingomonas bacterium]|nr:molybdopterin-guanine [Sphingomonas bacterium]